MSEDRKKKLEESGLIDWPVFSELIAMDEDEEGFSKSLFQTFVAQVLETFEEIDRNLEEKNLDKISSLGHYLKGSAAALGLEKISSQCERIQNYGHKTNFDNFQPTALDPKHASTQDDEYWTTLIEDAVENARHDFNESRIALNEYFNDEL